ncbi:hypothetical protein CsatB_011240 [Cannabis sativa]
MFKRISLILVVILVSWAFQATRPPPPKVCGSPGGPPITAPRIKLRDGRPGYGESDPDPNRTVKSLALDVENLADQLGLGSKFYVMGFSMGGQAIWGCLKYIPNRLAGAGLIAPVVNYWWPSFPTNISTEAYYLQLPEDQWALRVAHYLPWLTYWWNTQKWFPSLSVKDEKLEIFSPQDLQLIMKRLSAPNNEREKYRMLVRQQGDFESVHRDLRVGFGSWEFDPMSDLKNPFPNNEGSVHLWQGDEDRLVPVVLQRHIVNKLPWVKYHELAGAGHMFPLAKETSEAMMKQFLIGEK